MLRDARRRRAGAEERRLRQGRHARAVARQFLLLGRAPESSSLTIRATDGGKQLGVVSAPLASAVWDRDSKKDLPAPTWLDLSDGAGRVRAQLIVLKAPPAGAPHELKVLVGTWNVGNEPPPADLTSWLQCGQGRPKGGSRTPSRRNSMEELAAAGGGLPAPPSKDDDEGSSSSKASSAKLPPVAPRDVADAAGADSDDSETDAEPESSVSETGGKKGKKGKKAKKEKKPQPPPPVPNPESGVAPKKFGTYDMVVVGCQEGDYDPRDGFDKCEDDWVACLANTLGDSYSLHCKNTLGQMRICAFVRADVAPAVHHWLKSTEATGLGHIMNNKGGVGVSCRVWDTSVCFINSHLAAHDDMRKRRDDDFRRDCRRVQVRREARVHRGVPPPGLDGGPELPVRMGSRTGRRDQAQAHRGAL